MDQQRFIAVLSEVAAVGQGGLQINEPGTARRLKNLPGSWSDLNCLIHVGMKRLTPDEDSGLGIEAEYQEAKCLNEKKHSRPTKKDLDLEEDQCAGVKRFKDSQFVALIIGKRGFRFRRNYFRNG